MAGDKSVKNVFECKTRRRDNREKTTVGVLKENQVEYVEARDHKEAA